MPTVYNGNISWMVTDLPGLGEDKDMQAMVRRLKVSNLRSLEVDKVYSICENPGNLW